MTIAPRAPTSLMFFVESPENFETIATGIPRIDPFQKISLTTPLPLVGCHCCFVRKIWKDVTGTGLVRSLCMICARSPPGEDGGDDDDHDDDGGDLGYSDRARSSRGC